jgi:hypothetical protein
VDLPRVTISALALASTKASVPPASKVGLERQPLADLAKPWKSTFSETETLSALCRQRALQA